MIAAVYLRVSTDAQTEKNQEPDCLRLCTARALEPHVIRETMSGAKKRPGWERLKDMVRTGRARVVVFWALDRTGRTRVQIAHDLSELWRWGAQVVSVKDAWVDQPPGPLRDLLVQIMAWAAENERAKLIERTRAGIARARSEGKQIGRARSIPEPVRARILEMHAHCPDWTPGMVSRALKAEGLGDFHRVSVRSIWVRAA